MAIGDLIRDARIKAGLTQAQLADKLYVSEKTVSAWEKARCEPTLDKWEDICKLLTLPLSAMWGEDFAGRYFGKETNEEQRINIPVGIMAKEAYIAEGYEHTKEHIAKQLSSTSGNRSEDWISHEEKMLNRLVELSAESPFRAVPGHPDLIADCYIQMTAEEYIVCRYFKKMYDYPDICEAWENHIHPAYNAKFAREWDAKHDHSNIR